MREGGAGEDRKRRMGSGGMRKIEEKARGRRARGRGGSKRRVLGRSRRGGRDSLRGLEARSEALTGFRVLLDFGGDIDGRGLGDEDARVCE